MLILIITYQLKRIYNKRPVKLGSAFIRIKHKACHEGIYIVYMDYGIFLAFEVYYKMSMSVNFELDMPSSLFLASCANVASLFLHSRKKHQLTLTETFSPKLIVFRTRQMHTSAVPCKCHRTNISPNYDKLTNGKKRETYSGTKYI